MLSVTEQLDAGVRYLDLRVAHMLQGSEKNLHFVHMVYTSVLVEVGGGGAGYGRRGLGQRWAPSAAPGGTQRLLRGEDTHCRARRVMAGLQQSVIWSS